MGFGNLGIWEMVVIGLILLVVFGPRRLPEIARSMGKAMREFKKGVNEIQRELEQADREVRISTTIDASKPSSAPARGSQAADSVPTPQETGEAASESETGQAASESDAGQAAAEGDAGHADTDDEAGSNLFA